jgi:Cu2+-exporting ATPase
VAIAIASGDHASRVDALAERLDVAERHARQSPEDKLARLQAAHAEGHVTLAVGDGSNDAPLLAGADVSAALASGTELAQTHADLLLLDGHLGSLADARATARQLQRVIRQGRHWSLWYNLAAVPFAAFGLVTPWLAAIGMSLSSLLVVLHALRVGRGASGPSDAAHPPLRPREAHA